MRAVIQRVLEAAVTVNGRQIAAIGPGLVLLLGVEQRDAAADVAWLAPKIAKLRIFPDAAGKMNLCLAETAGDLLVVSQFTLHGSTHKGNRPSFIRAAAPAVAEPLYAAFCAALEALLGKPVARGCFGAEMQLALVNDGPVTLLIDTQQRE
jgi:D-tyrosyl-tRNA(Tyr) deacylase